MLSLRLIRCQGFNGTAMYTQPVTYTRTDSVAFQAVLSQLRDLWAELLRPPIEPRQGRIARPL